MGNRLQWRRNLIGSVLELMWAAIVAADPGQSLQADSSLLSRKSYSFTAVTGERSGLTGFKINLTHRAVASWRWPHNGSGDANRVEPGRDRSGGFQFP